MPGDSSRNGRMRRSRTRALVLLVASLWLLLLFAFVADPLTVAAASLRLPVLLPQVTDTATVPPLPIATDTPGAPTATPPGNSGGNGTATPVTTAVTTVTAVATAAVTATTAPVNTGGGGGGGGGGYQGSGPQPTRVVNAIPTAGAGGDGGLQALSPAAFGSNGLLLATTFGCVIAILGIIIAVIALNVLLRTGYGPFLRALVLGKRAGQMGVAPAGALGDGGRAGRWANWNDEDANDGEDDQGYRGGGGPARGAPAPSRAPVPSRAPQRQAPGSRSRPDWR